MHFEKVSPKYALYVFAVLALGLGGPASAKANTSLKFSACFNQAVTYYEQIYCEIKVKGVGESLPSFSDFKKNDLQMQALLLKRKAEALKIPFKMSVKKPAKQALKSQLKYEAISSSQCEYQGVTIKCSDGMFSLIGNQRNSKLKPDALGDSNKIALETFSGNLGDSESLLVYLTKSYARYVEKMLDIGLGGATMSFTKFYYLFKDLSEQGVDFPARFETMFRYLKLDKKSLAVSEHIDVIEGLSIKHCNRLKKDLFTCDNRTSNRVYVLKRS